MNADTGVIRELGLDFVVMDSKEIIENNFMYHAPKEGQEQQYVELRRRSGMRATFSMMWANASIARNG